MNNTDWTPVTKKTRTPRKIAVSKVIPVSEELKSIDLGLNDLDFNMEEDEMVKEQDKKLKTDENMSMIGKITMDYSSAKAYFLRPWSLSLHSQFYPSVKT